MDSATDLWIDSEISSEVIPLPVETRLQTVPFDKLGWENFERLCFRLAWRLGEVSDCRRYGIAGQDQKGIDIYVRHPIDGEYSTWQCKRHAEFKPSDIEAAVSKFLDGPWAANSKTFHLAVTVDLSRTQLANEIITQTKRCQERGIEFEPMDMERLSILLKEHPDLVDDFFGREWVEAFCGKEACERLTHRVLSKRERVRARRKLCELYAANFASVDAGLPAAAGALRTGTPPLPLHQRYIFPKAEAVTIVTEAKPNPAKSSGVSPESTPSDKNHLGFRAIEQRTETDLLEWLAAADQAVIVADTGLGKSATLRFIALDLLLSCPRNDSLARRWGNYLPIFVPFAVITRLVSGGSNASVPDLLKSWFQELSAPTETLDLLDAALKDERLLLLIDGLDEWNDATTAGTAITRLMTFAQTRKLPVIATSRPIGHQRINDFIPAWKKAELLYFDTEQQRSFTRTWFEHFHTTSLPPGVSSEAAMAAAHREANLFMDEIGQDADLSELAGIALLLSALICLRLQGQVLPRKRYDALDAITKTLIHEQPQRRARSALQSGGAQQQHLAIAERGIQFLAYHILASPNSTSISKDDARNALTAYYTKEFHKTDSEAFDLASIQVDRSAHEVGILVESDSYQVAFLHRSLQEFLAANYLKRKSFEEIKEFILEKLVVGGWQETILAVFHLMDRKNEVDAILNEIRSTSFNPLHQPVVAIFLSRVAFRDLNCSVSMAREIAAETFSTIEASTWLPLRNDLLREVVSGLDSDILGEQVRDHIKKWFPCRVRWRASLSQYLVENATPSTGDLLYRNLFNAEDLHEQKEIAEAIAKGAVIWPELALRLDALLTAAAETDILASALHALALGWPQYDRLPQFLMMATLSGSRSLRCVGFIHLAKKGDKSSELKRRLSASCYSFRYIYPWQDEVLAVLMESWPKDAELRGIALASAYDEIMLTEWDNHFALRYLVEAFPQDDAVAETIAEILEEEEDHGAEFNGAVEWDILISNFKAHPKIIPAAERWLQKHIGDNWDDFSIVQIARLAGTSVCRDLLFDRFQKGKMQIRWFINGMLSLNGGIWNSEIQEAVFPEIQNDEKAAEIADFLPLFYADSNECKKRLLFLLERAHYSNITIVFNGLVDLDALNSSETTTIWEKRLETDHEDHFWFFAKHFLLKAFPEHLKVRQAALKELDLLETDISTVVKQYAQDAYFRPIFERLLEPLKRELRLTLVQELQRFSLRSDPFAREILAEYVHDRSAEVKTSAARSYYAAIKKIDANHEKYVHKLLREMLVTGMDFDFRLQAAFAGLLALGHPEALLDPSLTPANDPFKKFSVYANREINWEFIRGLIEGWDGLVQSCGIETWKRFESLDFIVRQLFQAGRRSSAMMIPPQYLEEIRSEASQKGDSFLALSLLEGGQASFKDFCLDLFKQLLRTEAEKAGDGQTYHEIRVHVYAGHYLANHYAGDRDLAEVLVDVAKHSHKPIGPLVALCCGWPTEPFLIEYQNSHPNESSGDPHQAWLTNVILNACEFAKYAANLPEQFHRGDFDAWFPDEVIRAVQKRLVNDSASHQELFELLKSSVESDVIASLVRLLGWTAQDRRPLHDWCCQYIQAEKNTNRLQPLAYDLLAGEIRPLEFSIKDACLTR